MLRRKNLPKKSMPKNRYEFKKIRTIETHSPSSFAAEREERDMFERIGKKLVQGAKAEIKEEPIRILDTERLIEWAEIVIPIGLLALSLIRGLRKAPEPTPIVINNYISGGTVQ